MLLVASYYGNRDKLQPDGPLVSYTDLSSSGSRLTSWLFTKCGGVELGTTEHNPFSGREEDLNPEPPD